MARPRNRRNEDCQMILAACNDALEVLANGYPESARIYILDIAKIANRIQNRRAADSSVTGTK